MNCNKRKLTPLLDGVSRQLRSKLLRRKREKFSPVSSYFDVSKHCPVSDVHTELSDSSCVVSNSVSEASIRNVEVSKKDCFGEVSDSSCVVLKKSVSEASRRSEIEVVKKDCFGEVHAEVSKKSVLEASRRSGIEVLKECFGDVHAEVSKKSVSEASRRNVEVSKKDCFGEVHAEVSGSSCVVSKNSESEGSRRTGIEVVKKDCFAEVSDSSCVVSKNSVSEGSRRNGNGIEVAKKDRSSCFVSNSVAEASRRNVEVEKKDCYGEVTVEVSDCSCVVVSNSAVEVSRRNGKSGKEFGIEESKEVTNSVVSVDSVKLNLNNAKLCDENEEFEVESAVRKSELYSLNNKLSTAEFGIENVENVSVNLVENDVVSVDSVKLSTEETVSFPGIIVAELDLECSENFSNDDLKNDVVSVDSSYSSVYFESSEFESLSEEYSDSTWYNSGSQFSEKSDPDGYPSRTFQLLNEFSLQFYRSSLFENSSHKLITNDYSSDEITLLGLENDEDEENYRMLKSRERRQLYLRDYAAEYCNTGNGQLIIEQRLEMVHWIFEHSTNMELQSETMFLGINLLDRFFSKGYFKTKRSLQLAGIACLTLATRIEENQPYNSIRQKTFYVGNTAYSRCEVVAMEWLVQEILNFQCFLPTMYNFLWFYLKAARADATVGKTVGYLATLAMLSHEQMCYWPSTVAASLVILACKAAESDDHCHLLIESHSMEKDDTLPECIKRLEWLVKYC